MRVFSKFVALSLFITLLFSVSSCFVLVPTKSTTRSSEKTYRHDNGKHKGWYKNRHNPHHPKTNHKKGKGHHQDGKSQGNGNSKGKKH